MKHIGAFLVEVQTPKPDQVMHDINLEVKALTKEIFHTAPSPAEPRNSSSALCERHLLSGLKPSSFNKAADAAEQLSNG